jgi:uncharacterized membrane protein
LIDNPEHSRAATGYLVWPLAIVELIREPEDASLWSQIHARQAIAFGTLASVGYVVLLALPLAIVSVVPNVTTRMVVVVYATGILLDLLAALALFGMAVYYAGKASRGEMFAIPLVTAIADRFARRKR